MGELIDCNFPFLQFNSRWDNSTQSSHAGAAGNLNAGESLLFFVILLRGFYCSFVSGMVPGWHSGTCRHGGCY